MVVLQAVAIMIPLVSVVASEEFGERALDLALLLIQFDMTLRIFSVVMA